MEAKLQERLIQCLTTLKAEAKKKDEIYKHGVDLINYEREYVSELEDLIVFLIGKDVKEEIGWWIYEDVEKIYYLPDGSEVNVEDAETFLKYISRN